MPFLVYAPVPMIHTPS